MVHEFKRFTYKPCIFPFFIWWSSMTPLIDSRPSGQVLRATIRARAGLFFLYSKNAARQCLLTVAKAIWLSARRYVESRNIGSI